MVISFAWTYTGAQPAVAPQPAYQMHVAVMRKIGAVRLLYPQGDALGNQRLEFDITGYGHAVECEKEVAADPRSPCNTVWQQRIGAGRGVQFQEAILLQ